MTPPISRCHLQTIETNPRIKTSTVLAVVITVLPVFISTMLSLYASPWWAHILPLFFFGIGINLLRNPKSIVEVHDDKVSLHIGQLFGNPPCVEIPIEDIEECSIEKVYWSDNGYQGKAIRFKAPSKPAYLKEFLFQGKWVAFNREFWWALPSERGAEEVLRRLNNR